MTLGFGLLYYLAVSAGPRGPNRRTKGWEWQPPHRHLPAQMLPQHAYDRHHAAVQLTKKTIEPEPGKGLDEDEPIGVEPK